MSLSYRIGKKKSVLKDGDKKIIIHNTELLTVVDVIKNPRNDTCYTFKVIYELKRGGNKKDRFSRLHNINDDLLELYGDVAFKHLTFK